MQKLTAVKAAKYTMRRDFPTWISVHKRCARRGRQQQPKHIDVMDERRQRKRRKTEERKDRAKIDPVMHSVEEQRMEMTSALSHAIETIDAELYEEIFDGLLRLIVTFVPFRMCA